MKALILFVVFGLGCCTPNPKTTSKQIKSIRPVVTLDISAPEKDRITAIFYNGKESAVTIELPKISFTEIVDDKSTDTVVIDYAVNIFDLSYHDLVDKTMIKSDKSKHYLTIGGNISVKLRYKAVNVTAGEYRLHLQYDGRGLMDTSYYREATLIRSEVRIK